MVMTIQSSLTALADSIRSKTGGTSTMSIDAMTAAVEGIVVAPTETITDAAYLFAGQIPMDMANLFHIARPTAMNHLFYGNDANDVIDMTTLDFEPNPNPVACNNMFYTCDSVKGVRLAPNIKASSVMSLFQGCAKIEWIDLNGIDTSTCRDYRSFINGCRVLTEFDGSQLPDLYVVNNNCQNFFYTTPGLRKIWIPKEWHCPSTTAGYALMCSNGGSNAMNPNLQVYTDAVSEAQQIADGNWSNFTLCYHATTQAKVPAAQIHYGATHNEYLNA